MSSFCCSALMLAVNEVDGEVMVGAGKSVLEGVDNGETGLPSPGASVADGGKRMFAGDSRV